ncbi:MAG: hypothetical protein WKF86_11350 [Acidimicrobiales bacterium]
MLGTRRGPVRPVVVVFLVLSVLVVGIIVLGANHTSPGESRTEALAYLDKVRPFIERSSATGRDLSSLRERAVGLERDLPERDVLERDLLERQLTRIEIEADSAVADTRAVSSPAGGALAQGLLIGALAGRSSAVKALRGAFAVALDNATPAITAVQALTEVGRDLEASDGAYRLFARNLPPGGNAPPESRWVPDAQAWSVTGLGTFVTALRNSSVLAPVHDLAVVVATPDPGPVGEEAGKVLVLAQVPTVRLQIVVANQGNQPELGVPVTATTQPFDGSPPSSDRTTVNLEPGQHRALDVLTLSPPAPGGTFAIIVRVGGVSDGNPTDDEFPVRQYVLR